MELSGYTLILPSVAVGNVGQLCVDLVISSLGLRRAGRFWDTSFIPLVGADPFNENGQDICTAVDYYVSDEKKLIALQIRSPVVKRPTKFFHDLLNFVKDNKIAKVVILTSSFGHEKSDEQIRTAPFRYLATDNVIAEDGKKLKELSWIALEPKLNEFSGQAITQIHGGGYAKMLFEFFEQNNIHCIILIKFCSEGDNIPDAIEFANHFNQWLKVIPVDENKSCKLKIPPSWKFLFGNSPPREMY